MPQQPEQERCHHHIERREEAGVGDRCRDDAHLLQRRCGEENSASEQGKWADRGRCRGRCLPFTQGKGKEGGSGKNGPEPEKQKRPDVRHGRFLKVERHAPDERGEKYQQVSLGAGQAGTTSVQGAQAL